MPPFLLTPVLGAFGPAAAPRDPVLQQGCGCGSVVLVDFESFLIPGFFEHRRRRMVKASKISLLFPILSDSSISSHQSHHILPSSIFHLPSRSYNIVFFIRPWLRSPLQQSALSILPLSSSHPYCHEHTFSAPDPLVDSNFKKFKI